MKKTALKIRFASATPATTGKVASQIGIAPRRPAQLSIVRSRRLSRAGRVTKIVASGRATRISSAERSRPWPATPQSWLGKTSSPSMKKSPIWTSQLSPWWKATTVLRAGIEPVPRTSAVT